MKHRAQASQTGTAVELERLLGHTFVRPGLLTLALTHRSFVYDAPNETSSGETARLLADPHRDNEQLEFVGDAALGLLTAESLFRRFPGSREGELTRLRAFIVSRRHLGEVGARLNLGRWLRLGQTAEHNGSRRSAALFSNAVEALIAALYLDGGLEAARQFVEAHIVGPALPELERSLTEKQGLSAATGDHKSALQELLQGSGIGRPEYRLLEESGPPHARVFRVQVTLEAASMAGHGIQLPDVLAEAEGSSKKQAQQEAARQAIARVLALNPASRLAHD